MQRVCSHRQWQKGLPMVDAQKATKDLWECEFSECAMHVPMYIALCVHMAPFGLGGPLDRHNV